MKNLIWDLATLIRDAIAFGQSGGKGVDYEPPAKQFERITRALERSTDLVVSQSSTHQFEHLTDSMDLVASQSPQGKATVPAQAMGVPGVPSADLVNKFSTAVEVLEARGCKYKDGKWTLEPYQARKYTTGSYKLEALGFTFDGEEWQPPKDTSFAGMMEALLQIRDLLKCPTGFLLGDLSGRVDNALIGVELDGKMPLASMRSRINKIREVSSANAFSDSNGMRIALVEITRLSRD